MKTKTSSDARVLRSQKALFDALLRLLRDKSLNTITVSALCSEAKVHRTTFYGHAANIEEFAIDAIAREIDEIATVEADKHNPFTPYRTAMINLFKHIAEEREVFRTLLDSAWAGTLQAKLDNFLQHRVRLALQAFTAQKDVDVPAYKEETIAFVSGGIVGILLLWARSEDTDAETWATRVQELLPAWWPVK